MDVIPKAITYSVKNDYLPGLYLGKFIFRYNIYHLNNAIIHFSGKPDIVDFPKHMWRYMGTT